MNISFHNLIIMKNFNIVKAGKEIIVFFSIKTNFKSKFLIFLFCVIFCRLEKTGPWAMTRTMLAGSPRGNMQWWAGPTSSAVYTLRRGSNWGSSGTRPPGRGPRQSDPTLTMWSVHNGRNELFISNLIFLFQTLDFLTDEFYTSQLSLV